MAERDPRYFKVYQDGDDRELEQKIQQIVESGAAPGIDVEARESIEEIQRKIDNGEIGGGGGGAGVDEKAREDIQKVNKQLTDTVKETEKKANIRSGNLYNKFLIEYNTYVNETNGESIHSNLYNATDFIPVEPSASYTVSRKDQGAFYDSNKTYISGIPGANNKTKQTFTVPSNARFIRVSTPVENLEDFVINKGNDLNDTSQINVDSSFFGKEINLLMVWHLRLLPNKTYSLNWKNLLRSHENTRFRILSAPTGVSLKDDVIEFKNVDTNTTVDIHWEVQDLYGKRLEKKSVRVIANPSKSSQHYFSMIGDSLTMETGTVQGVLNELPTNFRAVGIRTFDNGTENHEGRGGWKVEDYTTRWGRTDGCDSPFLFPQGISGDKFYGNTAFWKFIVNNPNTTNYEYKGYDLIAKDWSSSNPYQYDANGYRLNPSSGDVMLDPTKPTNQRVVQYDGSSWVPLSPQPNYEISYAKYVTRFRKAFADGGRNPSIVAIMLGTNNFQQRNFSSYEGFMNELKKLTDSIKAYKSDIRVIVCVPPTSGNQTRWGEARGIEMTKWEFDRNVQGWASYLSSQYWKLGISKFEICNMIGVLQPSDYADWIHPVAESRYKIGQWLAGYVQWLR